MKIKRNKNFKDLQKFKKKKLIPPVYFLTHFPFTY